jgi:hypothetical protein
VSAGPLSSEDGRRQLLEVLGAGGTKAAAAKELGISRMHLDRCIEWARENIDGFAQAYADVVTDAKVVRLARRVVHEGVPVVALPPDIRRPPEPKRAPESSARPTSGLGIMGRDEVLERLSDAARDPEDPAYVLALKLLYDRNVAPEVAAAVGRAKREAAQAPRQQPSLTGARARVLEAVNRAKPQEDP